MFKYDKLYYDIFGGYSISNKIALFLNQKKDVQDLRMFRRVSPSLASGR